VSGLVFWVSGLVFWVSGLVFWVSVYRGLPRGGWGKRGVGNGERSDECNRIAARPLKPITQALVTLGLSGKASSVSQAATQTKTIGRQGSAHSFLPTLAPPELPGGLHTHTHARPEAQPPRATSDEKSR